MADKEPRRRKKRKDSVKKDDVRSEDPVFLPTRSESKDSDQEAEEEISAIIHQPSSFAKFVFIILFSGLVVSMSFIFISLHGAERGEVDIFDDHHSEEQLSLESTDQIDNTSSTDYTEDSENWSSTIEVHEETESWDAEFLPENLRNMLPDIKNILTFNNEEDKVSSDLDDNDDLHIEENEETISQEPEVVTERTYQDELNIVDDYTKTADGIEDTPTESMSSFDLDHTLESDIDEEEEVQSTETADSKPVLQETSDYYSEMYETASDTDSDQSGSQLEQSTNPSFSEVMPEIVIESATEILTEDSISSSVPDKNEEFIGNENESIEKEEESVGIVNQGQISDYEESDSFLYEKQLITNEEDFIREQFDHLVSLVDKNLPDDNKDEEENDEDEDNDKIEDDEFDFWQF